MKPSIVHLDEDVGISETYTEVVRHRLECRKWGKEFCLKCFGGGLKQFTRDLVKEAVGA